MRVYLAGPINGCTDEEATEWREYAKARVPSICWVDPMARDYRGQEHVNVDAIVEGDREDIASCEAILVNGQRASWGTAMEVVYAFQMGRVVLVVGAFPVSPWLQYHASGLFDSLEPALEYLEEQAEKIAANKESAA